jgi:hypothetical protein
MSLKRKTIIFVGGVALAAWFSAAMTPGRPPATSSAIRPAPIDTKGAVLAGEIERLRERLRPDAAPREAARNPFVFRSSQHAAAASRVGATVEKDALAAPPAVDVVESPRLRLTLAGIAEDPGPLGHPPVRTAIITGNGQVFLAKEGETVTDRGIEYRIGEISTDSAELTDVRDGSMKRLTLK